VLAVPRQSLSVALVGVTRVIVHRLVQEKLKSSVTGEIRRDTVKLRSAWPIIRRRKSGIDFGNKKTKIDLPTKVEPHCVISNLKNGCCHACGGSVFVVITLDQLRLGFYSIRRLSDDVSGASGGNFNFALH
jgi:hypothetical protein